MKKASALVDKTLARGRFQRFAANCMFAISLPICTWGGPLNQARVTAIIHRVDLLPTSAAQHPAALRDEVPEGTVVRTGRDSRVELTFDNQVVTRLNANALFNFKGRSDCDLIQGAVLIQAPKGINPVRIHPAGVPLAIPHPTPITHY